MRNLGTFSKGRDSLATSGEQNERGAAFYEADLTAAYRVDWEKVNYGKQRGSAQLWE